MVRAGMTIVATLTVVASSALVMAQTYEQQDGNLQPAYSDQTYVDPSVQQPQYGYQDEAASSGGRFGWLSGDWYVKLGGAVLSVPKFEGASSGEFMFQPLISVGKHGNAARFVSRNDNISLGLVDTGTFRAGPAAKLIFGRDSGTHPSIAGLSEIRFGGELGAFAEVYPTDFARLRAEVRHGIRSHDGVVVDLAADAFFNITDTVQLSGGPRVAWASQDYFEAYYGVNAAESNASGLAAYSPGSGFKSVGFGGAVTWKTTDQLDTSVFAEYARLVGPAADSSLVRQRGSENQIMIGASATYRFDFSLR